MAVVGSMKNLFIVVDPSQQDPVALDRALITARLVGKNMPPEAVEALHLHVYVAVDFDNVDTSADNPESYQSTDWFFDRIITPLKESGFQYSVEMSWVSDWYAGITTAAQRVQAERIMIPLVHRPRAHERLLGESVWHLLRTAPCPVLLCQPDSRPKRDKVLVAVNVQSHKPKYQRLNDELIQRGRWFADNYDAELHFVNAYSDSLHYPDRAQLAQKAGIERSRIHVRAGEPADVIASVAQDIDADVVVIGTATRASRWRGNTSERIITRIASDILVIN